MDFFVVFTECKNGIKMLRNTLVSAPSAQFLKIQADCIEQIQIQNQCVLRLVAKVCEGDINKRFFSERGCEG